MVRPATVKESVMRILKCLPPLSLLCVAQLSSAEGGLNVDKLIGYWSATQTRLQISAVVMDTAANTQLAGSWSGRAPMAASLGGDYYFSKSLADAALPPSGLRASTALLIRQPGVSLSEVAWSSRSMTSFGTPGRLAPGYGSSAPYDTASQGYSTLPYLGIGWSDYSLKSGWGFWADIGLVVQNPGSATGLGRTLSGAQGVDELVRELQLAPMIQLGVNYSF
jgi:hypothetical protein